LFVSSAPYIHTLASDTTIIPPEPLWLATRSQAGKLRQYGAAQAGYIHEQGQGQGQHDQQHNTAHTHTHTTYMPALPTP
jgi:hypothetical protein